MSLGMQYSVPRTLNAALKLLRLSRGRAKLLAGGTDLKLLIDEGIVRPDVLVDVTRIGELTVIRDSPRGLVIGGAATLDSIQNSPLVKREALALAEAASSVGSVQIRNIGTIGGNIANASPAADTPPALMALGATITLAGPFGTRSLPIGKFFLGVKKTCLASSEVITKIRVPRQPAGTGTAFLKFRRGLGPEMALVNVAVAVTVRDGVLSHARIAFGAVAPTVVRAKHAEAALEGQALSKFIWPRVTEKAMNDIKPITDLRTTESHRRALCGVLLERAVKKAAERALS